MASIASSSVASGQTTGPRSHDISHPNSDGGSTAPISNATAAELTLSTPGLSPIDPPPPYEAHARGMVVPLASIAGRRPHTSTIASPPTILTQGQPAANRTAITRAPLQPFDVDTEAQSQPPSSKMAWVYYRVYSRLSDTRKRHKHTISVGLGLIACAAITLELSSNISQFIQS